MYNLIGLISGEQSGCLQLRPRPAHQLRELGVRGRQPAAEAALLHPPLRELRLRDIVTVLDRQTNYPECLKYYYHGKAYVIISETMIFQNSMLFTLESGLARDSREPK